MNSSIEAAHQQPQQVDGGVQWLEAALAQLHTTGPATPEQRKAAEAALLQFQRSDSAWTLCLFLLNSSQQHSRATTAPSLLLFAVQTLRTKINEQGSSLPNEHKEHLKQTLLQQLLNADAPAPVLRQLCLAVASLASLLPQWDQWLQPVCASVPWRNAVQLLHDLAEEGSSDWRHVAMPGLTSSEKLSWATTTRDRFRSWSKDALELLHVWLQQHQQQHQPHQQQHQPHQQQLNIVCLLDCLTAWVKLGCLHHVEPEVAEATAHVGLTHIQSPAEQVVGAAQALLTELPEFATEQLLQALQSHMLQVAAAAVRAATSAAQDLMHAAAWVAAFAAYAAVVPQKLLAAEDDGNGGADLREALLQVAALPQVHKLHLICLPAIHVWSSILGLDTSAVSSAAFTAAGGGTGGLSRASTAADAEEAAAAAAAAAAQAAAAAPGAADPDSCHTVPYCISTACYHLLLHTACNSMLWAQSAEGQEAAVNPEAGSALQDLFLAVCCVVGQQHYLQLVTHVWQIPQPPPQQPQPQQPQQVPWLHEPSLQPVLQAIATAPDALRLQIAVELAAAAVVHRPVTSTATADVQKACHRIARLLGDAAGHIQRDNSLAGDAQVLKLTGSFCKAVQAWSSHLAYHFATDQDHDSTADMGSLLQLLVGIATQPGDDDSSAHAAAAAAVRALVSAALHLGWDKLYLCAPLLLQAVSELPGVESAEQDLFASLSMCLAAVGAPEQQLQALRSTSAQQLIYPAVQHVSATVQQLQAGQQWQGRVADAELCQHMVRVRVVLEAAWQRQEQQAHLGCQEDTPGGLIAAAAAAAGHCSHSRKASVASGMEDDVSDGPLDAWQLQPLESAINQHDWSRSCSGIDDPAVQLVLTQLWPLLYTLVVQHGAGGKFLQHYAKCCSKLLKIQPELLLKPQQQLLQFLEVAVVGLVRPGGCGLAEPLAMSVELCCAQQGSGLLLESAHCIAQVYTQLWSLPEVLALKQLGGGDAQPDLAEAVLKLSAAFIRYCSILQPSNAQLSAVLPGVIAAAAACARCCHKRVGSCALATLMALLAAAAAGACSQQCLLQEIAADHGAMVAYGALGALLVPSPLPRLQKVSSILLELAALASSVEQLQPSATGPHSFHTSLNGMPAQSNPAGSFMGQQHSSWDHMRPDSNSSAQTVLHRWLSQATQGFVPALLTAADAEALAAACARLLAMTPGAASNSNGSGTRQLPASRSYMVARRLKKKLRDFAESHMRHSVAS